MKKTKRRSSLWRARMAMRKRVKVQRRFDIELLSDDPMTEKQTCRDCGKSDVVVHQHIRGEFARRMAAYRNTGSGVLGVCKHCTKKARDEQYPLPKE